MSRCARRRASATSERASSMCIPADSAYCVTLSCSSRAIRWRSESSTSRCRAAPSSAWVACSSAWRRDRSSACRVVRASSRAEWSSRAQFCRAAAVWPARICSTERSVSSTSRSGGVHATNAPTARPDSRTGTWTCRRWACGSCAASPPTVPPTTASRCARTCSGTARTSVHSAPSGPSTRWRGRDSASSPSVRANTTHAADRCSAAASTTARTSASDPSGVRISADEIRSRAAITRRSRSVDVRCSGK